MRLFTALLALVLTATISTTSHAQLEANLKQLQSAKVKGVDLQKILAMKARADAAQAGQGKVAPGDVGEALRIAKQLGLSPKDLAARIHAQAGKHPALKGLTQDQLADHIRRLSKTHGKKAPLKKKAALKKNAVKKTALNNQSVVKKKVAVKKTAAQRAKAAAAARAAAAKRAKAAAARRKRAKTKAAAKRRVTDSP